MRIFYFLPIAALVFLLSACSKINDAQPTAVLPTGNFTGQFLKIHLNPSTSKYDTLKALLNLTLSQSTGFAVTGDTTTLHAGSFGSYAANAYYMQFIDQTYNSTKPGIKNHLEGVYNYAYNGTKLVVYVNYSDTLSLQYSFTKSN
jgi:hypothetical protein